MVKYEWSWRCSCQQQAWVSQEEGFLFQEQGWVWFGLGFVELEVVVAVHPSLMSKPREVSGGALTSEHSSPHRHPSATHGFSPPCCLHPPLRSDHSPSCHQFPRGHARILEKIFLEKKFLPELLGSSVLTNTDLNLTSSDRPGLRIRMICFCGHIFFFFLSHNICTIKWISLKCTTQGILTYGGALEIAHRWRYKHCQPPKRPPHPLLDSQHSQK